MMKKPFMKIQVTRCPAGDKVLITNLGKDACDEDHLMLYFENSRYCPCGGEVVEVSLYSDKKTAIVQFEDQTGRYHFNFSKY